jgi:hypothetical protein
VIAETTLDLYRLAREEVLDRGDEVRKAAGGVIVRSLDTNLRGESFTFPLASTEGWEREVTGRRGIRARRTRRS